MTVKQYMQIFLRMNSVALKSSRLFGAHTIKNPVPNKYGKFKSIKQPDQ